jgi:hypothetical protein
MITQRYDPLRTQEPLLLISNICLLFLTAFVTGWYFNAENSIDNGFIFFCRLVLSISILLLFIQPVRTCVIAFFYYCTLRCFWAERLLHLSAAQDTLKL